ncbi:hypothetical protein PIB30_029029 [Stylosanthes scabra]|uniref:Uncharacterized protein n=1 Tax=Stylosanthes scabra TaxID=79078 RepID=A0ABU6YBF2_9FABA|nr:hypothetical protein [Stylosanthes scabra]
MAEVDFEACEAEAVFEAQEDPGDKVADLSVRSVESLDTRQFSQFLRILSNWTRSSYIINPPPQAYLLLPSAISDTAWNPDSGASHHITFDQRNLTTSTDYVGTE